MGKIGKIDRFSQNFESVGGSKHFRIWLKFGMETLFMLENSWFNYIGDQRKSSKNETP